MREAVFWYHRGMSRLSRLRAIPASPALPAVASALAAARIAADFAALVVRAPEGSAHCLAALAGLAAAVVAPAVLLAAAGAWPGREPATTRTAEALCAGIGCAMAAEWILHGTGIRTPAVHAVCIVAVAVCAVVAASRRLRETGFRLRPVRTADLWLLAFVLVLAAASFESVAGLPFTHWDAVVSWDKWATDAAARPGLGRHVCGGYPQGFPLLLSAAFLCGGETAADPLSSVHELSAAALHFAFVLAALSALAAAARRFGGNAFVAIAAVFASGRLRAVFADPRCCGLADLPMAALALGALAAAAGPGGTGGRQRGGTGFPGRAALAAVFFGMAFSKGNGAALLPLTVVAAWIGRGRAGLRTALAPAAAAFALALPFWIHQWWFGIFRGPPDGDPLMHTMEVYVAHTRLFTPDSGHLADCVRAFAGGMFPGAGFDKAPAAAAAAVLLLLCLPPLRRRRTAPPAFMAAASFFLWFFTASYDCRNALAGQFFLAVCAGIAASCAGRALRKASGGRAPSWIVPLAAAVLLFSQNSGLPARPALPLWRVPEEWTLPPEERAARFSCIKGFHDFWRRAPWAARAGHLVAACRDFRLWSGKGVYAVQTTAFRDVEPGDLYFSFLASGAQTRPPEPFVPVASVANHSLGRTLWQAAPALETVPFSLRDARTGEALDADETIEAGRAVVVAVATERRDGVAEIELDRNAGGEARLGLAPRSARRDPYAKLFGSVAEGRFARTVWWSRKAADPPEFTFVPDRDCRVKAARIGP